MKKFIYPTIILSALTLVACGGGGGGGDTRPSASNPSSGGGGTVAPKLVDSSQRIGYYGDSTIFGWRTSATDQVDITAPEAFAAALPNSSIHTVTNKGLSGQTACELLNGTNLPQNWAAEMDQSDATVVILNHGINDAVSTNRVSVEQYRSCLIDLANIAESEGKRVIFETPNPIVEQGEVRLPSYVQTMRDVAAAEGLSLIDQYTYLNQQYGNDANALTRDGLHPTDPVYQQKGRYAASVFAGFNR